MTSFIAPSTLKPGFHDLNVVVQYDRSLFPARDASHHRKDMEEHIARRIIGRANIASEDLRVLNNSELLTLYEVYCDLENYKLDTAMIEVPPSGWDQKCWNAWIHFISRKYVDNNSVDMSSGESNEFRMILRRYWEGQEYQWTLASTYYNRVCQHNTERNKFQEMMTMADLFELSSTNPDLWDETDLRNFSQAFKMKRRLTDEELHEQCPKEIEKWRAVHHRFFSQTFGNCLPLQHNVITSTKSPEFSDPEDWDKTTLNQWLEGVRKRYNFTIQFSERHRRLLMIYVRCAWPKDDKQMALKGLKKMFHNDDSLATLLHQDILGIRSPPKQEEMFTKTESQRHRNRRDLHLWEFLLILLANPEFERDSIHWKIKEEGKFELSDRARVARMWGLTKGNSKMNYDNMSRSVRQYYKDDGTGIMIRHKAGQPSFGKYSYQFSMKNPEVLKLWQSLESP